MWRHALSHVLVRRCFILYAAPCVCVCVWTVSGCNWFHNVELMQHFFSLSPIWTAPQRTMAQITFQVNHSGTFPDVFITSEHQCSKLCLFIMFRESRPRFWNLPAAGSSWTSGPSREFRYICLILLLLDSWLCVRIACFVCRAYCKSLFHVDSRAGDWAHRARPSW